MDVSVLPWQKTFINNLSRFRTLCAGRKAGKTYMVPIDMLQRAAEGYMRIWYVSTAADQTDEVWGYWQTYGDFVQRYRLSPRRIILKSGTEIQFHTIGSDYRLRGTKIDKLYCDESAFMSDKVKATVWTNLSIRGQNGLPARITCMSTPYFEEGWFWEQYCSEAEDHFSMHKTWRDNPYIDPAYIAAMKRELTDQQFRQEYEAEFAASSTAAIPNVGARIMHEEPPPSPVNRIGIDLGRHNDRTGIVGLDCHNIVRFCTSLESTSWPAQCKIICDILSKHPEAAVLMDRSGAGDPIFELISQQHPQVGGIVFTETSRSNILMGLISAFQSGEIHIPERHTVLIKELKTLEFKPVGLRFRYDHRTGGHDDTVIALCLALRAEQHSLVGANSFQRWW